MELYLGIWIPHTVEEEINPFQPLRGCICHSLFSEEEDPDKVISKIFISELQHKFKKIMYNIIVDKIQLSQGNMEIKLLLEEHNKGFLLFKIDNVIPEEVGKNLRQDFWETTLPHHLKIFYHDHKLHSKEEFLKGRILNTKNKWLEEVFEYTLGNFSKIMEPLIIEYNHFWEPIINLISEKKGILQENKTDLLIKLHEFKNELEILTYIDGFLKDVDIFSIQYFLNEEEKLKKFQSFLKSLNLLKEVSNNLKSLENKLKNLFSF